MSGLTREQKLEHIRHLADVFDNDQAPEGWAEIERNDLLESGPEWLTPLDSDEEAALLVVEKAGMPGTAMALHVRSGVICALSGPTIRADVVSAIEHAVSVPGEDDMGYLEARFWICIVPKLAAERAGLESAR